MSETRFTAEQMDAIYQVYQAGYDLNADKIPCPNCGQPLEVNTAPPEGGVEAGAGAVMPLMRLTASCPACGGSGERAG